MRSTPELGGNKVLLANRPEHAALNLPVDHIGVAVFDVEEAMARYGRLFGITEWRRIRFTAFADIEGAGQPITGTAATGSLGNLRLEVVSPGEGRWTVNEVLESRGESVFHLGYRVENVAATLRELQTGSVRPALTCVDGSGTQLFAYVELTDPAALMIELVAADLPASFFLEPPALCAVTAWPGPGSENARH
jgi:catechol 2,3-dioxygenase-like lactoylglutathione lyase family enzyme